MGSIVHRLLCGDDGQDVIEYALLSAFIGLAGLGAVGLILQAFQTGYLSWDSTTQGLWVPPDPAGS